MRFLQMFWPIRSSRILRSHSSKEPFFWTFAAFGLIQVLTALGSMLPIFTFETQVAMIVIHRYSALAILLAAILFTDLTFIPQRRS